MNYAEYHQLPSGEVALIGRVKCVLTSFSAMFPLDHLLTGAILTSRSDITLSFSRSTSQKACRRMVWRTDHLKWPVRSICSVQAGVCYVTCIIARWMSLNRDHLLIGANLVASMTSGIEAKDLCRLKQEPCCRWQVLQLV